MGIQFNSMNTILHRIFEISFKYDKTQYAPKSKTQLKNAYSIRQTMNLILIRGKQPQGRTQLRGSAVKML